MNTYEKITEEVNVDHMLEVASGLAKWERLSGSDEEYEAFKWLEKQYQEYGFKTRLIRHDAYISLPQLSRLTVNGKWVYSQTHSMVPSSHCRGEMVYCPSVDMIKNTDCKGRVVLTRGWVTFASVEAAQKKGAVGVISIQDKVIRECIPSASWGSPTPDDWKYIPVIPVVSIRDDDGDLFVEKMKAGEVCVAEFTTIVDTSWRKIPLLIADLKAPVDTDQFCMFTGHVDSWYYGAIDNGTANAAQMEVARLVSAHQKRIKEKFQDRTLFRTFPW